MTIVSVENGDKGTVYDGNGEKVFHCLEANLSTGRVVVFVTDENGNLQRDGNEIKRRTEVRPLPMRFERAEVNAGG